MSGPHDQHISGVSTQNHSQAFVGTARDVYFARSEDSQKSSEQAAKACCNALFLTDPCVDRESLISAKGYRVAGTCEWITHDEKFRAWLDGDTRLIWISGGPGMGKTMMSIFLIEKLEISVSCMENANVVYYFCSHQDEKRNTAIAMLRGLVHQVVTKRPRLVEHALPYFATDERTQQTLSSLETLWIIFSKLVTDPDLGTMFCILDGLDECDEGARRILVSKIVSILSSPASSPSTSTAFRLAVVSREIPGLHGCARVKLDPDNNEKVETDIERFISTRVDELLRIEGFNDAFRTTVQTDLLARAEGTFLWVGFAMHELSQKQTCTQVLAALNDLPSGLPAIYSRVVLQIPAESRQTSIAILRWVTMALRPLQLKELAAAVGVQSPSPLITVEQAICDAITLCGPFLKVQKQKVSLVHQSARDYLLRKEPDSNAVLEAFRINPESASSESAKTCLGHIAQSGLQHRTVNLMANASSRESPFLQYASLHWHEHAKNSSALAAGLFDSAGPLFQNKSPLRQYWWASYKYAKALYHIPRFLPQLHIACFFGVVPWVEAILTKKRLKRRLFSLLGGEKEKGYTALHMASTEGNNAEAVVQLLVDRGADVNAKDKCGKTALFLAVKNSNEAVIQLLVNRGADVNVESKYGITVLHEAVMNGDEAVVQLLVDCGADVNAESKYGGTVLRLAAQKGRERVV